jgi:hypothetical protein
VEKDDLISLLHEFANIFAWTYANMPGLDTDIAVQRIPLVERSKPVKQKTRQIRLYMLLKVKVEIQK